MLRALLNSCAVVLLLGLIGGSSAPASGQSPGDLRRTCLSAGSSPRVYNLPTDPATASLAGIAGLGSSRSSHQIFTAPSGLARLDGDVAAAVGGLGVRSSGAGIASGSVSLAGRPFGTNRGVGAIGLRRIGYTYFGSGCVSRPESARRPAELAGYEVTGGYGIDFGGGVRLGARMAYYSREALPSVPPGRQAAVTENLVDVDAALHWRTPSERAQLHVGGEDLLYFLGGDRDGGRVAAAPGRKDRELFLTRSPLVMGLRPNVAIGGAYDVAPSMLGSGHTLWVLGEIEGTQGACEACGFRIGAEYSWNETIRLRLGYELNGDEEASLGEIGAVGLPNTNAVGIQHAGLGLRRDLGPAKLHLSYAYSHTFQGLTLPMHLVVLGVSM